MKLVEFLNSVIKDDGFLLIDADMNKHLIGDPKKKHPITLKILDKTLHSKLVLLPDLYFGEAYTNGSLIIENGTITDILEIAFKNIGRENINIYSKVINKIRGTYRYFTNFNRIINSKILFKCSLWGASDVTRITFSS